MKYDLNIYAIKYFVKVADMGNITNAAEELYITQPTLSRQISNLEDILHVRLLNRVRDGVELTKTGAAFYVQCKKLLEAYEEFTSKAFEFQNIVVGNLNIAHQKSSEDIVINVHREFLRTYPNVTVKNFRQSNKNFLEGLISGELHLAYMYGNELKKNYGNIKSMRVGTLKNMLLTSRTNPLAQKDKVHISELKNERFIMPSKTNSPYKTAQIVDACERTGFTPHAVCIVDSFVDYMLEIVRYDGVAILPYMHNVEDSNQVKYLELEGYEQEYPIHLAWCATNTNPIIPTYLAFVESLVSQKGNGFLFTAEEY